MNGDDGQMMALRAPPAAIEAEQAVLGGCMLSNDAFDRISDMLVADDFYRRDHQLIFRAIQELAEKNKPYDAVTLGEWFDSQGLSEQVAGGAYLIDLASTTPSAANIKAYAEIVRDKAVLRKLIDAGTQIVNDGFDPNGRDSKDILAEAEQNVLAIANTGMTQDVESGLVVLKRTVDLLSQRRNFTGDLLGITTSLDLPDEMTAGLQDDDLIILAARPSMGKSALMAQMRRACAKEGKRPYTVSLEMSGEQLNMRDIAAVGGVDFDHVRRPRRANSEEMDRIRYAIREMKGYEWWFDQGTGLTADKLCARIRRMKKQFNIGAVYIDYLQFIDISPDVRQGIPHAVQQVTRKLKATAKALHIPIVLLSQLNRSVESRPDKRPIMADLRESGAIEQDADVIMFLYRKGYYERDWPKDDPRQKVAEVIVAKVRNGEVGSASVQWEGKYQRFDNLSFDTIPANYYESKSTERGFEPRQRTGLTNSRDHDDNN